jgi:hypothetical protein
VSGRFYGVASSSPRSVWAVGLQGGNGLIMHWSGSRTKRYRWRVSFNKPTGFFYGVAATSARNTWAVGGTDWFSPMTWAEHWNGKTWNRVTTPTPGGGGYFEGVAATSASNAWAVGGIGPGPGIDNDNAPLIEHWNGRSWRQAQYPEPAGGQLRAVAATSRSNAWAVGWIGSGPSMQTLIEHWNGKKWAVVPSPNPSATGDLLDGVAVTSAGNAWAVGIASGSTDESTLIEHWNGKKWAVVPSPTPTGDTGLQAVAASSPTNAWAVGYSRPSSCDPLCGTVSLHWNGKRWAAVPSVNPPRSNLSVFEGVVSSARNAWAVGAYDSWSASLIEYWNGRAWVWHLAK